MMIEERCSHEKINRWSKSNRVSGRSCDHEDEFVWLIDFFESNSFERLQSDWLLYVTSCKRDVSLRESCFPISLANCQPIHQRLHGKCLSCKFNFHLAPMCESGTHFCNRLKVAVWNSNFESKNSNLIDGSKKQVICSVNFVEKQTDLITTSDRSEPCNQPFWCFVLFWCHYLQWTLRNPMQFKRMKQRVENCGDCSISGYKEILIGVSATFLR